MGELDWHILHPIVEITACVWSKRLCSN